MTEAEEERIRQLVEELDRVIPRNGACVRLEQYGGGPDEGRIIANQGGYLRFGIEFLKAGVIRQTSSGANCSSIAVDLKYLLSPA